MSKKPNKVAVIPVKEKSLELLKITPKTESQSVFFNLYRNKEAVIAQGYAGTGKTMCSLYLMLQEMLNGKSPFDKILIIRSVVPSRDMGFLPGSIIEKSKIYEQPYRELCIKLFGRGDAYDVLKQKKLVEFTTTSFLRGITFENTLILVDETQNMTWQELHTIMTRVGDHTKIVFCGDYRQTDLIKDAEKQGLHKFLKIMRSIGSVGFVEFTKDDIVRSRIVKEFIIKEAEYNERKAVQSLNGAAAPETNGTHHTNGALLLG